MKKREAALLFLKENLNLFQCPICHDSFQEVTSSGPVCFQKHSFDVSKKGTVHFLMKQSKNEYGEDMLLSRHKMMQAGMFDPVLENIFDKIRNKKGVTLDAGCGEGSHLTTLAEMGLQGPRIGFDISKEGIQLAATHSQSAFWCVADLSSSPFQTEEFDTILSILSPSHYQEFDRLVKRDGQVIKVVPEVNYLIELRQAFYSDIPNRQQYSNKEVVDLFVAQFPHYEMERVTYSFPIPFERRMDLLNMTPLSWNIEESVRQTFVAEGPKEVTVDLLVLNSLLEAE